MSYKKYSLVLMFICFVFFISASTTYSADDENARLSLKGLKGMVVIIEDLPVAFEEKGLTRYQIQTDVELKLRMGGISVLSEKDDAPGNSFLHVRIYGEKSKNIPGLVNFVITIELNQKVSLFRNLLIQVFAPTWGTMVVGYVGETFLQTIRDHIKDTMDRFINAYLSVNPKKGN